MGSKTARDQNHIFNLIDIQIYRIGDIPRDTLFLKY